MRILMLGWELPPHNSGGLGVACYQMSKALAAHGVAIDFVVPYAAEHPDIDYMNIHAATPLPPGYHDLGAYDHGAEDERQAPENEHGIGPMRRVQRRYGRFVKQFVKDNPPDAIHAHDWLTMEAGIIAKEHCDVPLIVHVHATEFDRSGEHAGNPLVHEIEQQGLMMADRIIAVSQITKDIIVARYGIPEDKVEVVYNAIDLQDLPPHDYDRRTYRYLEDLKTDGYTIVGVLTRLTVQKGLTYFVRAAAKAIEKHGKIAFLLSGDGEQRDELVALAAHLGISDKMIFSGFVRGKQWRDTYHMIDVFVMSSVSEPFGLTALEAAHHDTALLISRQSGVGEVLHNILRFDYWDTDTLADEIVNIATSPALKTSLKKNVKREYTKLSWHDAARQCLQLYRQSSERSYV
ncbi:MAG: glycosyltransferase family 4 protein [Candidatus Saccharibacteria bacterium]|nr:glycosyltransferase family 4 protein [Candidatus Saccharibacteria bacterium]